MSLRQEEDKVTKKMDRPRKRALCCIKNTHANPMLMFYFGYKEQRNGNWFQKMNEKKNAIVFVDDVNWNDCYIFITFLKGQRTKCTFYTYRNVDEWVKNK